MSNKKANHTELINEYINNYMGKIFYYCLKKTSNKNEAEELTQDITLNVISSLNKGNSPKNFSAWVWQITRNIYSKWAKDKSNNSKNINSIDINNIEVIDENDDVINNIIHEEQLSKLRRELAFIKSDYNNIIVAYYLENKSVKDIANSLSLSVDVIHQRLHRARETLKEGMNMERTFGKRSYNPEEIVYTNICAKPGSLGQPWTLMSPKLNQNIFLACYDNPMTLEELSIEIGVALPYMEDIVNHLINQTLLIKKGNKYETNFPIISKLTQQKMYLFFDGIMPHFVGLLTENIDRLMEQYKEADLCYYGPFQSYEDAKWMLLMDFYKGLYSLCDNSPKVYLGNTKRENDGQWDVIGFEKINDLSNEVGFHCQYNGFVQYRFSYMGIQDNTPAMLTQEETYELKMMIENKPINNLKIADQLVKYGLACKEDGKYTPYVAVISKKINDDFLNFCKKKNYSSAFIEHANVRNDLYNKILENIRNINSTIKEILKEDIPECISKSDEFISALLESICTTSITLSSIIKYALKSKWLKYDENNPTSLGAYFYVED